MASYKINTQAFIGLLYTVNRLLDNIWIKFPLIQHQKIIQFLENKQQ